MSALYILPHSALVRAGLSEVIVLEISSALTGGAAAPQTRAATARCRWSHLAGFRG